MEAYVFGGFQTKDMDPRIFVGLRAPPAEDGTISFVQCFEEFHANKNWSLDEATILGFFPHNCNVPARSNLTYVVSQFYAAVDRCMGREAVWAFTQTLVLFLASGYK